MNPVAEQSRGSALAVRLQTEDSITRPVLGTEDLSDVTFEMFMFREVRGSSESDCYHGKIRSFTGSNCPKQIVMLDLRSHFFLPFLELEYHPPAMPRTAQQRSSHDGPISRNIRLKSSL
jgi:hypothetical protein